MAILAKVCDNPWQGMVGEHLGDGGDTILVSGLVPQNMWWRLKLRLNKIIESSNRIQIQILKIWVNPTLVLSIFFTSSNVNTYHNIATLHGPTGKDALTSIGATTQCWVVFFTPFRIEETKLLFQSIFLSKIVNALTIFPVIKASNAEVIFLAQVGVSHLLGSLHPPGARSADGAWVLPSSCSWSSLAHTGSPNSWLSILSSRNWFQQKRKSSNLTTEHWRFIAPPSVLYVVNIFYKAKHMN